MTESENKTASYDVEDVLKKARQIAGERESDTKEIPDVADTPGASPSEEEDVKIYHPKGAAQAAPRRHDTRILDFVRRKTERDKEKNHTQELDEQLTFESIAAEEQAQEPTSNETELEAQLRDARREKVENFRLIQNEKTGFRLAGDEERTAERTDKEPPILEDYTRYEDTAAVRAELKYRRRAGRMSLWLSALMEFILFCLMLLMQLSATPSMEPITYLTLNLGLLVAIMLTAHRVVADGISSLFRLHATSDSVTACAAFAAVVHTVLQYLNLTEVANGDVTLYNAVVGLALVLSLGGRQARISRICRSFRLVSFKGDKYAAQCVADGRQNEQLGRFLGTLGTPEIVYMKKSGFLTDFMANSYDDEGHESLFRWFSPVLLVAAVISAVAYVFLGGESANWWSAIGVLTALLAVGSPAFAVAGANLPLCRAGKKLLTRGAALVGFRAVDAFDDVNGLMVDASDVFPAETMRLHGIKTFSGARIDEAILDAAAVSIAAGGPLSAVFRRVIENRLDMLQEVDTLLYEQEMGLSGWVGGRRVLVGNRRLLENHGVDVPSRDYESRYTKEDRQLVYLSTGGELCAMFVVSYTPDSGIAASLRGLEKAGVTLMVRTCDPNVTQSLIHRAFDIDEDSVRVLDAAAGRCYDALTAETAEQCEALLACNGRLEGIGAALSQCRRLARRIRLTGVLQMTGAGLGVLLTAVALLSAAPLTPLLLSLHLGLWALLTALVAGCGWGE